MKIINIVIFFALLVALISTNVKSPPVSGFYNRSENIIVNGEKDILLDTKINVFSESEKYTSIVKIIDVDEGVSHGGFFIDGDMFLDGDYLVAITKNIKEIENIDPTYVYVASSSPIVKQIQKSMLGVDVFNRRVYEYAFVNGAVLCYSDLKHKFIRCLRPQTNQQ